MSNQVLPSVSPLDDMAANFKQINQRLASLERASSGGGSVVDMTGFTFVQNPPAPTATRTGDTWYDLSTGESNVWDGTQWVTYAGGVTANGGFTYFQSATPTATTVGETWFDTNTGRAKVWDGFLWVEYALYPGGDTATGDIFRFEGGGDTSVADGTGVVQFGADGSANIGIDGNEIQARNGGAGSSLHLNLEGGLVTIAEQLMKLYSDTNEIQLEKTSTQFVWEGAGPNGLRQAAYSGGGGSLVFRTTPQTWNFEDSNDNAILQVDMGLGRCVVNAEYNDALQLRAEGATRPYMSFWNSSSERVMYLGYPDPNTDEVRVMADRGPLSLLAGNSTDGVRSSTIYNSTANDWGVFIEANGRLGRTASSERFKTNIEDLTAEDAAEILADFDWVRFNYIDDETGEAKDMVQFGGIAERLDEKRPEFVGYDEEDRPSAIRYNAVWPIVARVVQGQQERIDELEATVADLAARLQALEDA